MGPQTILVKEYLHTVTGLGSLHQENQGLSTARNLGLSVAKGEYIALLDDDDWWMPGKLELQVQILDKMKELAGVFTNFSIYRSQSDMAQKKWYPDLVRISDGLE